MITKENEVGIFLQTIKPGLLCKNSEVLLWTSRLLIKLGMEFSQSDFVAKSYEWFCQDNGGLVACISCLKLFPEFIDNASQVLIEFARYNLCDLTTVQMRKAIFEQKDYVNILHLVFKIMITNEKIKEEVHFFLKYFQNQIFFFLLKF